MSRGKPSDPRIVIAAIAITWAALAAIGPARAGGDGLPVPGTVDTTHAGVLSPDGTQRYLAIPHGGQTLVERIDARNGVLQQKATIDGEYVVPGVTVDGDTSGLATDGSALVLIRPRTRFPQPRVLIAVLRPRTLEVRRYVRLRGDFSFDAIDPRGRFAYLIQYPVPSDPTDYVLRRMRLRTGHLVPGAILPQNDPEEGMRGFPMSRATGPGGRWEYTLYDGNTVYHYGKPGEPFVHALDTASATTLCIDLDWLRPRQVSRIDLRMSDDGSEVEVVDPIEGVVGRIEATSGDAREVAEPFGEGADDEGGVGGSGWQGVVVALGGIAAGLTLLVALVRRRHQRAGDAEGEIA